MSDPRTSRLLSPLEADELQFALRSRRALGEWLGSHFRWHHFVTLTFANPVGEDAARRQFRRWIQRVGQRAKHKVGWFYALERGAAGYLHLHVLTIGTDHLSSRSLQQAWPCGRAQASRYEPGRAATYYITKGVGFGIVDYGIASPRKMAVACAPHSRQPSSGNAP